MERTKRKKGGERRRENGVQERWEWETKLYVRSEWNMSHRHSIVEHFDISRRGEHTLITYRPLFYAPSRVASYIIFFAGA